MPVRFAVPIGTLKLIFSAEEVLTIAPTVKTAVPSGMGRKSMDTRMDEALVKRLCLHINTADYCQATAFEVCPVSLDFQRYSLLLSPARNEDKITPPAIFPYPDHLQARS